jgi:hypothetical protein
MGLMPINGGGDLGYAVFIAPNGQAFYAPAGTDFFREWAAGRANGMVNIWGINSDIGHYGRFDYQRPPGQGFNGLYTNASNYGVGEYMQGAGFSLGQTIWIGSLFSTFYSKNANSPMQSFWWTQGWFAAKNQKMAVCPNQH